MKKQVLKIDWEKLYPPGYEWQTERGIFSGAIIGASMWGIIGFFSRYSHWLDQLKSDARGYIPEVMNFYEILGNAFFCFPIIIAFMLAAIAMHYAHHHSGSKSIYLMRRLPSRWELHRRCLAGPIIFILIAIAVALVLFFIFYSVYMIFTPDEWLTHDQLKKLFMFWSVM